MNQQPSRKRMGGRGERERLADIREALRRKEAKRRAREATVPDGTVKRIGQDGES
jgi:hypothetical protein